MSWLQSGIYDIYALKSSWSKINAKFVFRNSVLFIEILHDGLQSLHKIYLMSYKELDQLHHKGQRRIKNPGKYLTKPLAVNYFRKKLPHMCLIKF